MSETTLRPEPLAASLAARLRAATPPILYGLRLLAAVSLAVFVAFWLQLDDPNWAGTSAAIVCQPVLGASMRKGGFRLLGTVIGAVATVALTAIFPQDRIGFFFGVALWSAACSFVSTVLRNFAAYSAMLAGYTVSIIAGSSIAAPDQVFLLAVSRASEIGIGIVAGMLVMSITDFGGSGARLSHAIAAIWDGIWSGLGADLRAQPDSDFRAIQERRRDLIGLTVALDPVQDQAIGESGELGVRTPTLRSGINGLFLALSAWRSMAVHLAGLPPERARWLAGAVGGLLPETPSAGKSLAAPERLAALRDQLAIAADAARARPADSASDRLAFDRIASLMNGLSRAANTLVLIGDAGKAWRAAPLPATLLTDPLPPLVNAARVFVALIAADLIYIATSWDAGPSFLTFAAVTIILLSPQDERAGRAAFGFGVGTMLSACLAGIVKFALLPNHESFLALVAGMGIVLVPLAALSTRPALAPFLVPAVMNFVPLLAPTNAISFDTVSFYNGALAIVAGCSFGSLVLGLIPPVPPPLRALRLVSRTRADLRRLARRPHRWSEDQWRSRVYARLSALPAGADLVHGSQMLAALTVGLEYLTLRASGWSPEAVDGIRRALVKGDIAAARAAADTMAATLSADLAGSDREDRLRATALAREIAETLAMYPTYFCTRA